eukprot:m.1023780 g.1023780  ORF g.1023780 m.1023780 type:complete len:74 (-) comp24098_c0_seq33:1405-1626(-)
MLTATNAVGLDHKAMVPVSVHPVSEVAPLIDMLVCPVGCNRALRIGTGCDFRAGISGNPAGLPSFRYNFLFVY